MWLLNAETLQLEEYESEVGRPPYNVLSHRWNAGREVLFYEIRDTTLRGFKETGMLKIRNFCAIALQENVHHVWIDTCYVNKASSAELSEAINSMYKWYSNARVCDVFLFDIDLDPSSAEHDTCDQSAHALYDKLKSSVWFRRGWTLQELLAPNDVRFYDRSWTYIGNRESLQEPISRITGIDGRVLQGHRDVRDCSIAERMSWAAGRKTTRYEDRAYSLLGIFEVNMALLYGEGDRAFLRLQEEIIKHSNDHTIFTWDLSVADNASLLAPSADCFAACGKAKATIHGEHDNATFSMTNRGLEVSLWLAQWAIDTYLAALPCTLPGGTLHPGTEMSQDLHEHGRIGILLRRCTEDRFIRVSDDSGPTRRPCSIAGANPFEPSRNGPSWRVRKVKVLQAGLVSSMIVPSKAVYDFRIAAHLLDHDYLLNGPNVGGRWIATDRTAIFDANHHFSPERWMLRLWTPLQHKKIRAIKIALDFDFNPICFLAEEAAINAIDSSALPGYQKESQPQYLYLDRSIEDHQRRRRQNAELISKSRHILKAFDRRKPTDTTCWNYRAGQVVFSTNIRPGLWQLRGDHSKGLDVDLVGLGDLSEERNGCSAHVRMRKMSYRDGMIWDFDVIETSRDQKEMA